MLSSMLSKIQRGFRNRIDVYGSVNPLNASTSLPSPQLETSHMTSSAEKDWLLQEFSSLTSPLPLPLAQSLNSFRMVQMAESFEHFLHKKFSNYKRYSGEGSESLVPGLYSICQSYHSQSPASLILSIAHRGKLAVLVSLMNYPLRNLFYKVKGNSLFPSELNKDSYYYTDDIATHIALTAERPEMKGLKISMLHNPSHLEIGGGVGMGKTRAKIDRGSRAMHVWVHGDAALAGQGVAYELTQMAHLRDFSVGGTVHVVVNNQLGFTAYEEFGRSSDYCTDVFKIIEAPVIHVNAMQVEQVVKASQLAVKYRNKFGNDFVIDLVGYRRYGHNEVDDPTFTNPIMYKKIKNMKGCATGYAEDLISRGVVKAEFVEKVKNTFEEALNKEFAMSSLDHLEKDQNGMLKVDSFYGQWKGFTPLHNNKPVESGYNKDRLGEIVKASTVFSADFKPHPILVKNLQSRLEGLSKNKIDWATAEVMAIGSLLQQNFNVRLSGEDSMRGTFSQRHIGLYCQETERLEIPLSKLGPGKLFALNSLLSELGVVGFEYGYALDHPNNLVLWEAQFGDFANMAQPITDTYIAGGEAKWLRQSGLVLLLPHGQEGQGPDHSSALLERYLTLVNDPLSTQLNIEVANMVYPANYFHFLRRSMLRDFRRPLVIGTPKSGLRNKFAVSPIEDFEENSGLKPVIITEHGKGSKALVACSGKVYLDILAQFTDVSVMLVEVLAPLPYEEIKAAVQKAGKQIVWVQEEPRNLGVFNYIRPYLEEIAGNVECVSRPGLSVSSPGNSTDYKQQQESIFSRLAKLISSN